jgi:hypothetical protein
MLQGSGSAFLATVHLDFQLHTCPERLVSRNNEECRENSII